MKLYRIYYKLTRYGIVCQCQVNAHSKVSAKSMSPGECVGVFRINSNGEVIG
jgi:hypothetical protein